MSVVALATTPVPALFAKDAAPATMSADDERLVLRALNRGQLMYAYDQAAWHGTDDMRTKLPDFAGKVGGWIVDGPAQSPQLVFYSADRERPKAVYVADFRDNQLVSGKVLSASDDATLSPERLRMIGARRAAVAAFAESGFQFCANASANSIVLPPETPGGPYLVYLLTPQTSNDSVPLGGHFLFEVADGKIAASRRFTKSCIDLTLRGETKDKVPAALMLTHLPDPTPTELHVFTMFAAQLPLYVATAPNRRVWVIESSQGRARIDLINGSGK